MGLIRRFGGVMTVFALMIGFGVLGFAASQPGLLFVALLCWWPLFIGVIAWTARGLRDHYQLVPKVQTLPNGPQQRRTRPAPQQQEEF